MGDLDRHDELGDLTVLAPDPAAIRSRADVAYYRIRDLIVTLDLPPGAPIREPDLMARLGLGRTPVREGLRRLAVDGLVSVWPRRGMVVAPVDARDLGALSEVRLDLEVMAAGLAAVRATPAERESVAELVAELDGLATSEDPRTLIVGDQQVHRLVYRSTHNPFLARTLEEYLVLSLRLWFLGLGEVSRLDEAVGEHRDLLVAIERGDADAARATMAAHIRGFQYDIGRVLAGPTAIESGLNPI